MHLWSLVGSSIVKKGDIIRSCFRRPWLLDVRSHATRQYTFSDVRSYATGRYQTSFVPVFTRRSNVEVTVFWKFVYPFNLRPVVMLEIWIQRWFVSRLATIWPCAVRSFVVVKRVPLLPVVTLRGFLRLARCPQSRDGINVYLVDILLGHKVVHLSTLGLVPVVPM